MNPTMKLDHWPRLSQTLSGPVSPEICQGCGVHEEQGFHLLWQECDAFDRPESIYVALCKKCSDSRIEKHPRLYVQVEYHKPIPGTMRICVDCSHRNGLACKNPDSLANGGSGIEIIIAKPTTAHILRRGKGARSGWIQMWPSAARDCTGRQTDQKVD